MLDQPTGADILDSVSRLLRDTLMPALPADLVFQARVAANAIDLVAREIRLAPGADQQAQSRLAALLSMTGSLDDLEAQLASRIRHGEMNLDTPGLFAHLLATAMSKVAVDQPSYQSYREEFEQPSSDAHRV